MTDTSQAAREAQKIKDDDVYGPTRAQICDEYIAAGKPKPERNWLYSRLVEARMKNAEHDFTFDLRWKADMRAVKMWREAHPGNELVIPDHADMVTWMLEQQSAIDAETKGLRRILDEIVNPENWFDDCGEWEWLPTKDDGGDYFGGCAEWVREQLAKVGKE